MGNKKKYHRGNTELNNAINRIIKREMHEKLYTGQEMADIVGLPVNAWYQKVNHGTRFNLMDLKKICDEFLITLDDLVNQALKELQEQK